MWILSSGNNRQCIVTKFDIQEQKQELICWQRDFQWWRIIGHVVTLIILVHLYAMDENPVEFLHILQSMIGALPMYSRLFWIKPLQSDRRQWEEFISWQKLHAQARSCHHPGPALFQTRASNRGCSVRSLEPNVTFPTSGTWTQETQYKNAFAKASPAFHWPCIPSRRPCPSRSRCCTTTDRSLSITPLPFLLLIKRQWKAEDALTEAFSFSVNRSTVLKWLKFGGRGSRCPNESSIPNQKGVD